MRLEDPDPPAESETVLLLKDVTRSPDADRVTLPEKPFKLASARVEIPLWPCWMVRELGLADILKSGVSTFTYRVAYRLSVPLVPFTVT
jgi:hypothetical protein